MKFKFNIFCDALFFSLICFVFVFAWVRFYLRATLSSLLVATTLSVILFFTLFHFFSKRNAKQNLTKAEAEFTEELIKRLNFLSPSEVNSYFFENCTTKENPVKTRFGIIFQNTFLFAPIFSNRTLSTQIFTQIISFAHKNSLTKIIFCAQNVDAIIKKQSQFINITCEFWDKETLFNKKGRFLTLPICPILSAKPQPIKLNERLISLLDKARAKHYILFGIVLLVFSVFIPMKIYYLTFGSILLILGVITLLIKKNYQTNY